MTHEFDAIVIGGGPAGAATAGLLAKAGRSVAVFEMREFPRFQVGESLIPAVNLILGRLGVLDRMDDFGFPRKYGVQFISERGPGRPFYFEEASDSRMHQTWQVVRSDFDAMLLDHAGSCGATVETRTHVTGLETDGEAVTGVYVRREGSPDRHVRARVVIDASGQKGLLARKFGGREHIAGLENTAVYAHWENAALDCGKDAGSTLIYRINRSSWIWFIPLPDTVSIGLVAPAERIAAQSGSPAEILDEAIAGFPLLAERLKGARRTMEVKVAPDFSYRAKFDGGEGWLLVGDALGFMDPIYSTGLYLAMKSAEIAGDAVDAAMASSTGGALASFSGWSAEYQEAFDRFRVLVEAYYREGFSFSRLSRDDDLRRGLVDLLTGIVDSKWAEMVTEEIRSLSSQSA
ncbi:MAG: alkylhalidase [Planctomycetes bacterium]|nr:alkylhalidase [Planctomycetota bacterium]